MSHPEENRTLNLWSLCEDVVIEPGVEEGELVLTGRWGKERIDDPDPALREALSRMELGPVLLANVEVRSDGPGAAADSYLVLLPMLSRLSHMVVRTLGLDDLRGPLLSVSPATQEATFEPVRIPSRRPVRLPAEATLTLEQSGFSLQAAGAPHRVVLHRPEAVWVVGMLAWPVTPDAACEALPIPAEVTERILDYLAAAGMAAPVDGYRS